MAKFLWRMLTIILPLATITLAFIFPQTWARFTLAGLAIFEILVFYLLEKLWRQPTDDPDDYSE